MSATEIDRVFVEPLFARWVIEFLTGKQLCGWCGCDAVADCGKSCRACFGLIREQRVRNLDHTFQTTSYLAGRAVEMEECREYLARISGADRRWCRGRRCGHSQMLHTDAGCTGLTGDDFDGWSACSCRGFTTDRAGTPAGPR